MCRKIFNACFSFTVYFQLLDKNVTDDKSTVYEIMEVRNNSIFGKETKAYEIAQSSPKKDFNITEETPTFGEYQPESNRRSIENVFTDVSNVILNVTVPNFDEYESESTQKPLEDINKNYDNIKVFEDYKDGQTIIRVTVEIPCDDCEPELDDYSRIDTQSTTKNNWLGGAGILFLIIAGLCAVYRRCRNYRSCVAEGSSEDVTTAFIIVIPKSGKDPKFTGP